MSTLPSEDEQRVPSPPHLEKKEMREFSQAEQHAFLSSDGPGGQINIRGATPYPVSSGI